MSDEAKKVTSDPIESKGINPQKLPPDPKEFQSMMQTPQGPTSSNQPQAMSPMELAQANMMHPQGSLDGISANIAGSDGHLAEIQKKLEKNPNLKFKRQHEQLLKNKMQDANTHLRKMNTKLGASIPESDKTPTGGPVEKFLSYVTDGQRQLLSAKAKLEEMGKNTHQLNPANLLSVQIQAAQAQQNLEYSSILLSKVIETFKQMLNIQL